jgi:(2Fe-2S) ferredoxin
MAKFQKHIFVCTNQRPEDNPRGCCNPTGGAELQRAFKAKVALLGLKGTVRVNQSGCLDQCEHGPTVVIYPEATWYGHVTLDDVDEIIKSNVVGNSPVERLLIPDSCLNAESCPHKPRKN